MSFQVGNKEKGIIREENMKGQHNEKVGCTFVGVALYIAHISYMLVAQEPSLFVEKAHQKYVHYKSLGVRHNRTGGQMVGN